MISFKGWRARGLAARESTAPAPAAAATAAGATAAAAAGVVKRAVEALPGTWWTTGLPKWMHIVRRRMITKEDWLHVHAASGLVSNTQRERMVFLYLVHMYVRT